MKLNINTLQLTILRLTTIYSLPRVINLLLTQGYKFEAIEVAFNDLHNRNIIELSATDQEIVKFGEI